MKIKLIALAIKLGAVLLTFILVSELFYTQEWVSRIIVGHLIVFTVAAIYYRKNQFSELGKLYLLFFTMFVAIVGMSTSARAWLVEQGNTVGLNPVIIADLLIMMSLSALTASGVKFFMDAIVRHRVAL